MDEHKLKAFAIELQVLLCRYNLELDIDDVSLSYDYDPPIKDTEINLKEKDTKFSLDLEYFIQHYAKKTRVS